MNFSLQSMILYGVILFVAVTTGMKNENNDQITQTFRTVTLEDSNSYPWGMGVNFNAIWKKWQITKLSPGKQANTLGIQKDWKIISVDDDDLNEENWKKIEEKLRLGKKIKIKFATNAIDIGVEHVLHKIEKLEANPCPFFWKYKGENIISSISMTTKAHRCFYKAIEFAFDYTEEEIKRFTKIGGQTLLSQYDGPTQKAILKTLRVHNGTQNAKDYMNSLGEDYYGADQFMIKAFCIASGKFIRVWQTDRNNEQELITFHDFYGENAKPDKPDSELVFTDNGSSLGHFHIVIPLGIGRKIERKRQRIPQYNQETLTEKHVHFMWNALSYYGKYNKSVVAHMKEEFPHLTTEDVHKVYTQYAKPELEATSIKSSTDIQWNCKSCTFLNNSISKNCKMCENPKTVRAKPELGAASIKPFTDKNQWNCASCTFLNKSFSEKCEMCKKPKTIRVGTLDEVKNHVKSLPKNFAYFTEHDVNLGNQNENTTPLMSAAANGNLEYVKFLLKHGADVKQASPEGWTALHLSVYYQHFEIIKILLEHDNMNIFQKVSKFVKTFNSQNKYVNQLTNRGYSPLDIAVSKGNLEIFGYLLKHGAKLRKS